MNNEHLKNYYGFSVVKPQQISVVVMGERLVDSWPWYKKYSYLAWSWFEEYILPPLLMALAITAFQISARMMFR